jgi:Flp pilus assembly protein TadD
VLPCLAALVPLAVLTVERQAVFAGEGVFWNATQQASPFSPRAHCGLGTVLLQSGQPEAAIAQFQKALELDPQYGLAHMNLGVALFEKGQFDEAMVHFQKAVELFPSSASAREDLGIAYLQKGRAEEAAAQFQEAVNLQPGYTDAINFLAKAQALARQKADRK